MRARDELLEPGIHHVERIGCGSVTAAGYRRTELAVQRGIELDDVHRGSPRKPSARPLVYFATSARTAAMRDAAVPRDDPLLQSARTPG